jgi:hypothetical protein
LSRGRALLSRDHQFGGFALVTVDVGLQELDNQAPLFDEARHVIAAAPSELEEPGSWNQQSAALTVPGQTTHRIHVTPPGCVRRTERIGFPPDPRAICFRLRSQTPEREQRRERRGVKVENNAALIIRPKPNPLKTRCQAPARMAEFRGLGPVEKLWAFCGCPLDRAIRVHPSFTEVDPDPRSAGFPQPPLLKRVENSPSVRKVLNAGAFADRTFPQFTHRGG